MIDSASSYPFPVLGPGRLDYGDGSAYETADWKKVTRDNGDVYVELQHLLVGENLVSQLVRAGEAVFGCMVVIKATMYRRTFFVESSHELSIKQSIPIEKGKRTIELPKFMPVVIYMGDRRTISAGEVVGGDEYWQEQGFVIHRGAIIARDKGHEFIPGLGHLLNVKRKDDLRDGEISVNVCSDSGGYFTVYVAPDLYRGMMSAQARGSEYVAHRNSILTHALSVGFAELAEDYSGESGESDLELPENFQAVKRLLEAKGMETWEDGEEFSPCEAACIIEPHLLDSIVSDDEDDDV